MRWGMQNVIHTICVYPYLYILDVEVELVEATARKTESTMGWMVGHRAMLQASRTGKQAQGALRCGFLCLASLA